MTPVSSAPRALSRAPPIITSAFSSFSRSGFFDGGRGNQYRGYQSSVPQFADPDDFQSFFGETVARVPIICPRVGAIQAAPGFFETDEYNCDGAESDVIEDGTAYGGGGGAN